MQWQEILYFLCDYSLLLCAQNSISLFLVIWTLLNSLNYEKETTILLPLDINLLYVLMKEKKFSHLKRRNYSVNYSKELPLDLKKK